MANNIEKLLTVLTKQAQSLEDALQQLKTQRFVDTAVGAQLDVIGRVVNQLREGLGDDDYRRYIRARIAANNSHGTVEDVLLVAFLIVYDNTAYYKFENHGHATAVLKLQDLAIANALADILIKFLGVTVSDGVRVILEYSDQPVPTWFQWDTAGVGWDNGTLITALDN